MKRNGILNADLAHVLASLGHGDGLLVVDAGFPIPARRMADRSGAPSPRPARPAHRARAIADEMHRRGDHRRRGRRHSQPATPRLASRSLADVDVATDPARRDAHDDSRPAPRRSCAPVPSIRGATCSCTSGVDVAAYFAAARRGRARLLRSTGSHELDHRRARSGGLARRLAGQLDRDRSRAAPRSDLRPDPPTDRVGPLASAHAAAERARHRHDAQVARGTVRRATAHAHRRGARSSSTRAAAPSSVRSCSSSRSHRRSSPPPRRSTATGSATTPGSSPQALERPPPSTSPATSTSPTPQAQVVAMRRVRSVGGVPDVRARQLRRRSPAAPGSRRPT